MDVVCLPKRRVRAESSVMLVAFAGIFEGHSNR